MHEVSTDNFRFEHLRWHQAGPSRMGYRNNFVGGSLQSAVITCLQCQQSWDAREGRGMDANGKDLIICCPNCGNGESIKAYILVPRME